jgi:hypothetical protein
MNVQPLFLSAGGGCDWNAGVPAGNAVASVASSDNDSTSPAPDGRFASVAGGDACVPVASAILMLI